MKTASTTDCVEALLHHWIAKFGVPDDITSDRGTPFTSNLWTNLAQRLGITAHHTTSYNPEANGMVERMHRTLKAALMLRCEGHQWFDNLPWILLGLRTTPKEGINATAAEMVYGDNLQVPGDFFTSQGKLDLHDIHQEVRKFIPCKPTYKKNRQTYTPPNLSTTTHAFLRVDAHRPPLTPPYISPFKILQRKQKTNKLDISSSPD